MKGYTKIYRFDDYGFNCKPYYLTNTHEMNRKLRGYPHSFNFISSRIDSLNNYNQPIESKKIISYNSTSLIGCFCFLDEFDKKSIKEKLPSRRNDRKNTRYISLKEYIWVRNTSHKGIEHPYYDRFIINDGSGPRVDTENISIYNHLMWVQMPVYMALERTKMWKLVNKPPLPEWLTEFYLMEEQLNKLKKYPFKFI